MNIVGIIAGAVILARLAAEFWLSRLNRCHVLAHANAVPEAFRGIIDEPTYKKSVEYTLAKERFGSIEEAYGTAVLLVVLFCGVLPWIFQFFKGHNGLSAWSTAAYLFVIGMAMSLPGLPFEWYGQFRLEERFGFNTTTQKTWWLDRIKGVLLAAALGYPLLVLILKIVEWT